jgi:hypothetical protein
MARRAETRVRRDDEITLADVERAVAVMARIVQLDGTAVYLPIFERALAERDSRRRQAELIHQAAAIAAAAE